MHLTIQYYRSVTTDDFLSQFISCLSQLILKADHLETKRRVVKITVFTSCSDNADYLLKMNLLANTLSHAEICQAPVVLVSQPPSDGGTIMEVWMMEYSGDDPVFTYSRGKQASILHVETPEFRCLFSTQYSALHESFKENSFEAFSLLNDALGEYGFAYSDIVRQWNYIENITMLDTVSDKQHQNYQIFNDMRSFFYSKSDFVHGYPSATGIGIENGGCSIEVIAYKEKVLNSIKPVRNSLQVDAYSYSANVLVGEAIDEVARVSTPKFERGKYMHLGGEGFLFISGTASIIGEKTVFAEDVETQTLTTMKNIDHLVDMDNLEKNKISIASRPTLLNYRVYLKDEADYEIVKSLCEAHYGINKGFFVKADICRSSLLVEIEANYSV
jgi:enamine deaminase RidA (YjgF/YER057c/UK114 family)